MKRLSSLDPALLESLVLISATSLNPFLFTGPSGRRRRGSKVSQLVYTPEIQQYELETSQFAYTAIPEKVNQTCCPPRCL